MGKIISDPEKQEPIGSLEVADPPSFIYKANVHVEENEEVVISVDFPGTGTTGETLIDIQRPEYLELSGEGEISIGKRCDLKTDEIDIEVSPVNITPQIDNIRANISINGRLTVRHSNPKKECSEPLISLKILLTSILLFFISGTLAGQTELGRIKTPNSPAAYIAGLESANILQPKTFEALETAFFSNFTDSNGNLSMPGNFALEFSPYWAMDEKVSMEKFLFPDMLQSLLQTSSFSVASTRNYVVSSTGDFKALGFGFRASLGFTGENTREEIRNELRSIKSVQKIRNRVHADARKIFRVFFSGHTSARGTSAERASIKEFADSLSSFLNEKDYLSALYENEKIRKGLIRAFRNKLEKELLQEPELRDEVLTVLIVPLIDEFLKYSSYREKLELFTRERPGFNLAIAAAISLGFPDERFDFSFVPQKSIWLSPSYTASEALRFSAVLRYSWYNSRFYELYVPGKKYFDNNFDYGLGLSFTHRKFTLNLEAAGRSSTTMIQGTSLFAAPAASKTESDHQYMATLSYNISSSLVLSYNLGKQFNPLRGQKGNIVSGLALNLGFGGPTTEDITIK